MSKSIDNINTCYNIYPRIFDRRWNVIQVAQQCPECRSQMLEASDTHHFRECGLDNVWLDSWSGYRCSACHVFMPILPDADILNRYIASRVVRIRRRLNGDEISFLRSVMRMKLSVLAERIQIRKKDLSRAESKSWFLGPYHDHLLRKEVLLEVFNNERPDLEREVLSIYHDGPCSRTIRQEIRIRKEDIETLTT